MNIFSVFRIFLGCVFVVSGSEKLIGPYQNFLYVVQNYALFGGIFDSLIVRVLPWIEFFIGVFLVLGFWLKYTLRGSFILIAAFVLVVAQALMRNLPITECGCFGELATFPLSVILIMDSIFLILTALLLKNFGRTSQWSLDKVFSR